MKPISSFFLLLPTLLLGSAQQISSGGVITPSLPTPAQVTPTPSIQSIIPCNNSPLLCNRPHNNITHIGAHDSSFLRDSSTSNSVAGNQFFNATIALSAGVRLLTAQVHTLSSSDSTLHLCHSYCALLDAGPLTTWLSAIKYWLDNNPNDVITLILVNSDNQPASAFGEAFDSSGISSYGFVPPPNSSNSSSSSGEWPTLQSMISSNKRLVTFIASIPTTTSNSTSAYPFLLPEFQYIFETSYNITSPSQFNCELDRPSLAQSSSKAIQSGLLPLINHFQYIDLGSGIQIPDVSDIGTTNSPDTKTQGNLGKHLMDCKREWEGVSQKPVFVLVDFFDRGPSVEAGDLMNGLLEKDIVGRVKPKSQQEQIGAAAEKKGVPVVALVGFLGVAVVLL
ncbi:PLC-like phosphodiesterase [Podospora fimiseda]|uniref:PLC-like phosphodiesterase n=1 Tax=Podospora fimiseda TaxID=252190 RepID=A0AAN7H3A0_9PEZI|nr:PLC-like phosphodiesterase [Podospora fimiseda]